MTMTDPIADMLTRLRNANQAYHDSAVMPSSKLKTHIAEILQQEGYIAGWNVSDIEKDGSTFKQLSIDLKYGPNRERSIAGVRRVSKPGLRVYAKSNSLPKVLGGLGVASGVDIAIDGQTVSVRGPKGSLTHTVASPITVERDEDGTLRVQRPNDARHNRALHGLSRTLIANMITGVTEGYTKTLEIVGVGYRVQARGSDLEFALGFSHPVPVKAPAGITFAVESPTRLRVTGIDKQQVGEVAAKIRKIRKPDPYKGKGVRYQGEVVKRKVGKTGK